MRRAELKLLKLGKSALSAGYELRLSYPFGYDDLDGVEVKRHLDCFRQRFMESHPAAYVVWVMQYWGKERDALHVHAYVVGADLSHEVERTESERRINRDWWEIVGSGDLDALHDGVHCKRVENPLATIRYVCRRERPAPGDVLDRTEGMRWAGEFGRNNRGRYEGRKVQRELSPEEAEAERLEENARRLERAAKIANPKRRQKAEIATENRARWQTPGSGFSILLEPSREIIT